MQQFTGGASASGRKARMNVAGDDNSSARMANQIRRKKSQLEGDLDDGLTKRKQKKINEANDKLLKQEK